MADGSPAVKISFDAFEIDLKAGEVRKDGRSVKLAPQPFSVLVHLASRAGQIVTREEIQRNVWGEETFVDFDLGLNQCIRQIRAALGDDAQSPRFIETLSRRGYRFIAPVKIETSESEQSDSGTPSGGGLEIPRLEEASGFPNPVRSETSSATHLRNAPASSGSHQRILWIVIGACLATVVALIIAFSPEGFHLFNHHQAKPIRSLAVLPFRNLSDDPSQEYFAEGMTDELITDLAQISTLRIISRTSVTRYKDTRKSLPEIARELNVDAVVEGSVVHAGNRVRVTAQLVEANPERHLWAKTFDRSIGDALDLQREIANDIAKEIRVKLTPQERKLHDDLHPGNAAAEDAYLKGHYYFQQSQSQWDESAEAPLNKSISYFQQATELDPNFSQAYAGLATAYDVLLVTDVRDATRQPSQVSAKAKAAAFKALEINASSPWAHVALAGDLFGYDWDWARAEAEFEKAIALSPGYATGHYWYAMFLAAMGRSGQAIAEIRLAEKLNPFSPGARLGSAWIFYQARRYDDAIAEDQAALALDPDSPRARYSLGWALVRRGLFTQAAKEFQEAADLSHGDQQTLSAFTAYLDAVSGKRRQASRTIRRLEKNSRPVSISPYVMAEIYTALGEKGRAFASLEKAYQQRQFSMVFLKVDPDLDGIRSDARFQSLLRRMAFLQ